MLPIGVLTAVLECTWRGGRLCAEVPSDAPYNLNYGDLGKWPTRPQREGDTSTRASMDENGTHREEYRKVTDAAMLLTDAALLLNFLLPSFRRNPEVSTRMT